MSVHHAFQEEKRRLEDTLLEIERQRARVKPRYFGDDFTEQVLDAMQQETLQRLETLYKEPYFGRLDFQEQSKPQALPLYIGKRGMDKEDTGEPYIIDWRAPVASLFYSFTGGDEPVSYEAPYETVQGELHLKRNLTIRDNTLLRVVDSYVRGGENQIGVSDEFLLYRLGERKDNRLRDIVSTIQAEQDRIIRAPRNKALIIQGAAGSGKTTVALHRLAFLLYQYREKMRAERMIIFAPNSMFLDYISAVLPELGVGNVKQVTFAEWAIEQLDGQVKLRNDQAEGAQRFSLDYTDRKEQESGRVKGSLAFKDKIDAELQRYEESYVGEHEFVPWEGCVLPAETIREWFYAEYRHFPLAVRQERFIGRLKRWLEIQLKGIADPNVRKTKNSTAKQRLKSFIKQFPEINALALYARLVDDSSPHMKKGFVQLEDLVPLVWIHFQLHGFPGQRFDHVVVDEAQDVSPFQISLLNSCMSEPSFTILGDLAQGIHDYRGVHRWEELSEVFEVDQVSYHELRLSYRSTLEIIEFANKIIPYTDTALPPAQPVFRSGEPVAVVPIDSARERIPLMQSFIQENQSQGMKTIAIIGRTSEDCDKLHAELKGAGVEASLIKEGQSKYIGGISIVPVYLSKGLEFDAVLIMDADSQRYTASSKDAKLLYVGCTRALHRLTLSYMGEHSPLIEKS